jgi:uncharacterized protein YrrD
MVRSAVGVSVCGGLAVAEGVIVAESSVGVDVGAVQDCRIIPPKTSRMMIAIQAGRVFNAINGLIPAEDYSSLHPAKSLNLGMDLYLFCRYGGLLSARLKRMR